MPNTRHSRHGALYLTSRHVVSDIIGCIVLQNFLHLSPPFLVCLLDRERRQRATTTTANPHTHNPDSALRFSVRSFALSPRSKAIYDDAVRPEINVRCIQQSHKVVLSEEVCALPVSCP